MHRSRRRRAPPLLIVTVALAMAVVAVASATTARPALWSAQRVPMLAPGELPLGLGIAHVAPVPGGALHFYNPPRIGESVDDMSPVESVRFVAGRPSVEIAEAPPWFVPEHLKMDYELLHLRVLTLTPDWVEVVGNSRTGETRWVRRPDVRFVAWPEHLLEVAAIELIDPENNPVRTRPLEESSILATTAEPLPPLAVSGDWLKVSVHHLADRMPPEGWVRWRRGDRLLVVYSPLS